ncbi:PaaI family thioesterase [Aquisalimonas sp. 2447]|uniref:PaaI family thioesterase n=1 Tax=Aquisalimonas sp. 2447 TaxID=2740807 RepID=UPI0014327934|nr:PaaI family thioesterase [Aquisalimonas sp. 2447]QIT55758.1 PaaI family thioesterase [Aquisalimonas sp. 2447]
MKDYSGEIAFTITDRQDDHVLGEMPVRPGIMNPFGTVHAGAMLWFADVVATHLVLGGEDVTAGMQGFPLAINLNANLTGNQKEGTLRARAEFVKRGRSVSVVRTQVTGDDGRLLVEVTTSHVASR